MAMRVDESRHTEEAPRVDTAAALVARMRSHDAVADHGNVGAGDGAGDDVEHVDVGDNQIGRLAAPGNGDSACERVRSISARAFPF